MTQQSPIQFIDLKAQRQRIGARMQEAIMRVVEHGGYIMGPEVRELESQLAAFTGARHCISCASGTDSLSLVLMAWNIQPGDAVFVPAFTFVATAEVVALLGATPVFVDVLEDSFNMDPASFETAVADAKALGLRPAAVMPVDLFGQPADYTALMPIAERHGIKVLADAAQSFGGSLASSRVGTFGHATSTSFFPAKPLGCYGDGGAIFTDDDDLADILRSLRVHGQGSNKYDNVRVGINGRLDTIQAAILLEKLRIFPEEIDARNVVATRYNERLGNVVKVPTVIPNATSVWAQYTIRVDDRECVQAHCKEHGVPSAVYYPIPLSRQTGYLHYPTVSAGIDVSERLSKDVMSLPMHPYLDKATQDRIIAAVTA